MSMPSAVATLHFRAFADRMRPSIDAALGRWTELNGGDEALGWHCPPRLREAMRYSLLAPGKRLRPLIVLLSCEACGGNPADALGPACAVEMVHAYSLIHDDLPCMDDDDLRRGQPTCHKKFDEATAVLAGDALLALAFEVLSTCDYAGVPERAVAASRCCAVLARAAGACALVGGQSDDLAVEHSAAGTDALARIHARKTAAMMVAAAQLGGICAHAAEPALGTLADYGYHLGMAFQIMDDVLDVRGQEAVLGKRVNKDSGRGKMTYPGLIGVTASLERARAHVETACQALAALPRAEGLEGLAMFVLERDR